MRLAICEQQISAGDGSGDKEGAAFDAIRNDSVRCAVQARDALYAKSGGAHTFDFGAHSNQEFGEIGHFGFERGILEDGLAFGQNRCRQNIFSAGNSDFRETECCAAQALNARFHIAVFHLNLRAEFFESLDVNVDGTGADGASARKRNACVTEAGD